MKLMGRLILLVSLTLLLGSCSTGNSTTDNYKQAHQSFAAQDYQTAFTQVQAPANAGNAEAEYALGYMYFYGKGTDVNQELGKKWIARSAAQGNDTALKAYQMILSQEQTGANMVNSPTSTAIPAPTTPTVSTPAPVTAPATTKSIVATIQYTSAEQEILHTPKNHYAIQLAAQPSASAAQLFINSHHLSGKGKYFRRTTKGHTDYVVIMGNYPTHTAASATIKTLPASLQHTHPWPRSYGDLQAQLS
jgi:septal ring-binding cell division protein DamX